LATEQPAETEQLGRGDDTKKMVVLFKETKPKHMKLNQSIQSIAGLAFASTTLFLGLKALAQTNRTTCSFNGRAEKCVVNWKYYGSSAQIAQVTWLSDGKQSWYLAGFDGGCEITEDNGRKTNCRWSYGSNSKKAIFKSSRGNTTVIPSWHALGTYDDNRGN